MAQEQRFRIIKDRDDQCPFCDQADIIHSKYKGIICFRCEQCGAVLIHLDKYYMLHSKDRKVFDNTTSDEIKSISMDNFSYKSICEKERAEKSRKIYWEQRAKVKQRKEKEEEIRTQKKQIKVDKEYGDGPLGNLPKQRKRGFYS